MDSDAALNQKRVQIRVTLKDAITRFAADTQLDTAAAAASGLPRVERFCWVQDQGNRSLECLSRFWKDAGWYSPERIPEYLHVSLYTSLDRSETVFTSLESFFEWLKTRSTSSGCNNMLVVTVPDEIRPPNPRKSRIGRNATSAGLPSPQQVCVCAAVAALLLGWDSLGYESRELYHLLAALLNKTWSDDPSLLTDLGEEELYPSGLRAHYQLNPPSDLGRWHTVKTTSIVPGALSRTAVKTLVFPDEVPEIKPDWQYVHIFKPHAKPPTSRMRCSIWGKHATVNGSDQQTWDSVLVLADHRMYEAYRHILHEIETHTAQPFWTQQTHHWVAFLEYLYILGINNARLLVRETVKGLRHLKYKNIADTDSASLHSCLMYAEHLNYQRKLMSKIREELEEFPTQWTVSHQIPPWIDSIRDSCRTAENEIAKVYKEAVDLRKLLMEQHSLSQARTTVILTILASTFIPLAFVTSFFGMNTREINDSSWPITYFVAVAIPLTGITILIPLYALRIFSIVARLLQGDTRVRKYSKWALFSLGLSLAFISAVLESVGSTSLAAIVVWFLSATIAYLLIFRYVFQFQPYLISAISARWSQNADPFSDMQHRRGKTHIFKQVSVSIFLHACLGLCIVSYVVSSWILFGMYVIYGFASLGVWIRAGRAQ
ncbi:hypothetical protein BJX68DRAFT_242059 [Aspergillus pseudodeflectus]|uniref:Uncharacterized protein n=1 Tax=Aspergillus pseudodeflectus TaxID=176178 RepID=A0ABR4K0T6_9EURO